VGLAGRHRDGDRRALVGHGREDFGAQAAAAAAEGLTRLRLVRRAVRFFRRAPAAC
jgi:hypothetical protein